MELETGIGRYKRYYQSIDAITKHPRTRNYTAVIFSFLAISLFGWYAIRPTIQTILLLRREIEDDKKVSKLMEDKIAKLIDAQASYQKVRSEVSLIPEALPQDPDAIHIAAALRSLGDTTNASVSAITIADSPLLGSDKSSSQSASKATAQSSGSTPPVTVFKGQSVSDIPFNVTVEGPYSTILSYINELLSLRRIISIETLHLGESKDTSTANASSSATIQLQLVLKLNAHYLSD